MYRAAAEAADIIINPLSPSGGESALQEITTEAEGRSGGSCQVEGEARVQVALQRRIVEYFKGGEEGGEGGEEEEEETPGIVKGNR